LSNRLFNFKNTGHLPEFFDRVNQTDKKSKLETPVYGIKLPLQKGRTSNNTTLNMCSSIEDSVDNNLRTFLMTKKGERLGQASFGTSLHEIYNMTDIEEVDELAVKSIVDDLAVYFPFVTVKEFTSQRFDETETTSAHFKLNISYNIAGIDDLKNIMIRINTSG